MLTVCNKKRTGEIGRSIPFRHADETTTCAAQFVFFLCFWCLMLLLYIILVLEQRAKQVEIRASGVSILRTLIAAPSPNASSAAIATSSVAAPCRALLESLHACGGRPEAIRLLSSLELFGDKDNSENAAASAGKLDAQATALKKQSREDGTAVLVAVVTAVTAAASAIDSHGGGSYGGGGGNGDLDAAHGLELFGIQESQALSLVCVEALRALVRGGHEKKNKARVAGSFVLIFFFILLGLIFRSSQPFVLSSPSCTVFQYDTMPPPPPW